MEQGARIVVEDWLQAQSDDVLHFITDETKLREAEAFAAVARVPEEGLTGEEYIKRALKQIF